jgi:uncharacterized protein YabN with tetrapyrrole methylase and pyrophosphatase domain
MKSFGKIGEARMVEKMSLEQVKGYWMELKEARYDSYFYREMMDRIVKMNPNIVWPAEEEVHKIEQEALQIAMWEENWEKINEERIGRGGTDYTIFREASMWVDMGYSESTPVRLFSAQKP